MDFTNFNERQKTIVKNLRKEFDSDQSLYTWLSIPNKMFRSKPPIDLLMSENYDYFDRLNIELNP